MKRSNGKPWNRGENTIKYLRSFPGAWAGLIEHVEVTVCDWDDDFEARCHASFPNELREQWNVRKVFPGRNEAAAFAAAFVLKSEEIVAAMLAGETPILPNEPMREALKRELPLIPAVREARAKLDDATTDRDRTQAKDALRAAESEAELAWWRSHDWRDFVAAPPKTTLAAEAEEDDHDDRIHPAA